jgi:NAD(P)-dependent dehydrogenase (short-subunit alcohol dehydrogenase family)
VLAVEHADSGIRFFNVNPGGVATERIKADMAGFGFSGADWAPPALIGAVLTWLAISDDALSLGGIDIQAQELSLARGLYPEWTGNAHA